jgi:xylan 1,4-beta-xylosidase
MGSPAWPTRAQITELRKDSNPGSPEVEAIQGDQLTVSLPPMGLAVIEIH